MHVIGEGDPLGGDQSRLRAHPARFHGSKEYLKSNAGLLYRIKHMWGQSDSWPPFTAGQQNYKRATIDLILHLLRQRTLENLDLNMASSDDEIKSVKQGSESMDFEENGSEGENPRRKRR